MAMNAKIEELMARIRELQAELEADLEAKRAEFRYRLEHHRVRFEHEVLALHRRLRTSSLRYLLEARFLHLASAPVIYGAAIPLLLADLAITLYQTVCFPIYGIPRVRRAEHFVYDRGLLPYLNTIEKFNCIYCSYGNGLMAYGREIIARTEQYWCPIKHARRLRAPHEHYSAFFDYGDAERYAGELEALRARLAELERRDAERKA
jgi:hypothetical protein